ncbi:MAG: ABC transporter permease [Christensenellaceae bacterium]|nr:ABC transporter permease [Christensenellaceae bacterium]
MDIRLREQAHLAARAWRHLTRQKAVVAIGAMLVGMLFFDTKFYTPYNLMDMLKSAAIVEILAFGVTLPVLCGGCDFSIGGTMSLAGILTILMMGALPMWAAIAAAVLAGALIGFVNGFFVARHRTEPFIITLGMGMLLKGIGQQLTDAHPISAPNLAFMKLANGKLIGSVPNLVVIMALCFIAVHGLLRYTAFGRNCYAIGGDYAVAQNSGINAVRIKWITYVLCGMIAAVGGVLLSSKLNTGSSLYGDATALTVNCGCVVGGTSFAGGVGGVPQTFVGLLAIQLLENCMNMLGISAYVQQVCKGAIIIAIIWSDCFGRKRKREAV